MPVLSAWTKYVPVAVVYCPVYLKLLMIMHCIRELFVGFY